MGFVSTWRWIKVGDRISSTQTDKTRLQRQIDAADREIDRLVYDLYGLTEKEIRIVEEATFASMRRVRDNEDHASETGRANRPS